MEETKRKQLEAQLRQLINASNKDTPQAGPIDNVQPGKKIQVIRRRKGRPDRQIPEKLHSQTQPALQ
jgi:hypothetical protein